MQSNQVNLIDFGLAKAFRNARTRLHIPFQDKKGLLGNPCYCSVNTHLGIEPTRCDDLESLAYVLIYFLRGSLPWQGLETDRKEDNDRIMELKKSTDILCHDLPKEFILFLNYTRALRFDEKPNYQYLSSLFCDLSTGEDQCGHTFEWSALSIDGRHWRSFDSQVVIVEPRGSKRTNAKIPLVSERR